jgi:nucleotide-binding universal stress UspA family protein
MIVATDGSASADRAVDAAAQLAKVTGADLMILTIGENISGAELRRLASAEGDLAAALETAANETLDRARKRALCCGAPTVKVLAGWGDPSETIMDIVARENPDLLVVGRRGRGRLSGLLLGSVSQKLASLAPCKVLVVP